MGTKVDFLPPEGDRPGHSAHCRAGLENVNRNAELSQGVSRCQSGGSGADNTNPLPHGRRPGK